jgi:hypothetical protein
MSQNRIFNELLGSSGGATTNNSLPNTKAGIVICGVFQCFFVANNAPGEWRVRKLGGCVCKPSALWALEALASAGRPPLLRHLKRYDAHDDAKDDAALQSGKETARGGLDKAQRARNGVWVCMR